MTRLLPYLLAFLSAVAGAKEFPQFSSSGDDFLATAQQVSEKPIVDGQVVVWVGKVVDVSVYRKDDGATAIEWTCEQHPFQSLPEMPLTEPLRVKPEATGHFVVTLNLPDLSVAEAEEKLVKSLKSPAWVLVRGEPVFAEARKGIKAVFLHSLAAALSDTLKVEIAK